ncbi:hypothetical protein RKD35_002855 [Streptomyces albogriseolus]
MGRATDAILAYGYDLGGPDDTWHVQETNEYGVLNPRAWWNEEQDDPTFLEAAQARLAEAGVTGVEVRRHCTHTYGEYLLVTTATVAHRGYPKTLDLDDLTRSQLAADWDDQLAAALAALGLTSTQDAPAWLLAVYAELD